MKFASFSALEGYLYSRVLVGQDAHKGEMGMKRMAKIMEVLDNPQDKIKVIHVAGTSGKGSTVFYISKLLNKSGFRVGSMISPHLVDVRERAQINGEVIEKDEYIKQFNEYVQILEGGQKLLFDSISYLELLVGFAYYYFQKSDVDYAVIETGMGGSLDYTNVANSKNKVCVLTRIGMDHMHILGNSLEEIAVQKSGIIWSDNLVIALNQEIQVNKVIEKKVEQVGAKLNWVSDEDIRRMGVYKFATDALYQRENAAIAIKTVKLVGKRDGFDPKQPVIEEVLQSQIFKGRMSLHEYRGRKIILDGAHNEQKMAALVKSIGLKYGKVDALVAFKKGKNYKKMLMNLLPVVDYLYLGEIFSNDDRFKEMGEHAEDIEKILKSVGYHTYELVKNPINLIKRKFSSSNPLLVTGSLYLVSEIYREIGNS